jgi:hypothetical protein
VRPAAPVSIGKTDETIEDAHDGTITGVSASMEYKADGESVWTAGTGQAITGLIPGDYYVRYKATTTAFYGETFTVEIKAGAAQTRDIVVTAPTFGDVDDAEDGYARPAAKAIVITNNGNSSANIERVIVSDEAAFEISGSGSTVDSGGAEIDTWTIQPNAGLGAGTYTATITVAYDGSEQATANVSFTVNARKYDLTVMNGEDRSAGGPYAAGTEVKISAYSAPAGQVFDKWVSEGGGSFIPATSIATTFIMPDGYVTVTAKYRYATPDADIDFRSETLTGLVPGGTYSFDGETPVVVSETTYVLAEGWMTGSPLSVVRKSEDHVADSTPQELIIPARPAAPNNIGKTDETVAGEGDGTITGVDTGMEYKAAGDSVWTAVTGSTVAGLIPGSYQVRYAATDSAFHGLPTDVTIADGAARKYALTVVSGADRVGGGAYAAGARVSITADSAPSGMVFDRWTSDAGGSFDDAGSPSTTFTMPASAVTVTATYTAARVDVKPVEKDFGTYTGSGDVTAKVDADYTAFVRLLRAGAEVDAANYTITQGSTIITLKEGYLKTLESGTHVFVAEFSDGVSGSINLVIAPPGGGGSPGGDNPPGDSSTGQGTGKSGGSAGQSTGASGGKATEGSSSAIIATGQAAGDEIAAGSQTDSDSPGRTDEAKANSGAADAKAGGSHLALWLAVIAVFVVALAVFTVVRARRRREQ